MTLTLRPLGRGNWAPTLMRIEQSKHAPLPLELHVGQHLTLAGKVFRVSKVGP